MDEAEQITPAQLIFFQRLHKMITNARIRSGCIDWLPEGNGFIITSKTNFADDVLSVYFPNAKISSFFRRLKRWGFKRLLTMSGAFEHSVFRRGMNLDDSVFSPSQLFPIKSQNDEPSLDVSKEERLLSGLPDVHIATLMREINREKRRDMTPTSSGGKVEAAQALASLGSSEVAHQENPRDELQMDMRLSHEAIALSRARSYSQQMTMAMMHRHHEQFPWRYYIQDLQRRMAPEYGIDGRESFQPPSPLQRQVMVPDTWKAPEAKHVSCVSTSVDEQPDLASLQKIRQDLDDSRRELLNRNVDDSFCQLTGDSSGRVPLPNSLSVRSPYNRAA